MIICEAGTLFKVNGKKVQFKDIKCQEKATSVVLDTKVKNPKGQVLKIGFQESTGADFVPLIQVLYNQKTGTTLYTKHLLHGKAKFYGNVKETRTPFKSDGTVAQVKGLSEAYTGEAQKKRFKKTSGAKMLVKGHLTPYCDAIFPPWKHATQFYVNTAPQWRRVNGANWIRVENLARKKARALERTLEIYTGTYGSEMTLMENGYVEVPLWFWKIIRDPVTNRGIAFVTYNDVFAADVPFLLEDISPYLTWADVYRGEGGFRDITRGYTIICDVNELMKIIGHIPPEASVEDVLDFEDPDDSDCGCDGGGN